MLQGNHIDVLVGPAPLLVLDQSAGEKTEAALRKHPALRVLQPGALQPLATSFLVASDTGSGPCLLLIRLVNQIGHLCSIWAGETQQ